MAKEKNIILIYPKTGMDFGSTVAPPHALLTIAAPLHRQGYRIEIIDQRVDKNWQERITSALGPETICVGISCMTGTQIYFAVEIAKAVRRSGYGKVPIVWGGPHPSILPAQTLAKEYVDIVCVGEGDVTFPGLVKALETGSPLSGINGIAFKDGGKVIVNSPAPLLDMEDLLPVPWELIDVERYIHPDMYLKRSRVLDIGQTSRGCPFNCGFCCSASLRMRKWRAMSVAKSLERIIGPVRKFNLDGVWIRDDEFYIDRDRANKICAEIVREDLNIRWYTSGTRVDVFNKASGEQTALLKKSGAYVLKFGAESGNNRILKLVNKGITVEETIRTNLKARTHDIIPAFALMIGFPTETFDEVNNTIDLIFRLKKDNPKAQFETMAIYTALPGTPMYELALGHGLKPPQDLEEWSDWNFDEYDFPGKRIPWFNARERERLGNISYMSVLANALPNAIDSIENLFLRSLLKILYRPVSAYYRFRLRHKMYSFSLDLAAVRYLRKKIFYRSHIVVK
ncbi:MAG: radical SAM protein [Candidatus Omnitrophota bacterium]